MAPGVGAPRGLLLSPTSLRLGLRVVQGSEEQGAARVAARDAKPRVLLAEPLHVGVYTFEHLGWQPYDELRVIRHHHLVQD